MTLQTLRWDEPSDFTTFERAAQTAEDHASLNGVALKITKPYVAVIIQNCIGPEGRVPRWLRIAAKRIGGYWELRANQKDVVGILKCDTFTTSEFGTYYDRIVFYCLDGVCHITGRAIPGLEGDPELTNIAVLGSFYWRFKHSIRIDQQWRTAR
jgi:hypothetical protein